MDLKIGIEGIKKRKKNNVAELWLLIYWYFIDISFIVFDIIQDMELSFENYH